MIIINRGSHDGIAVGYPVIGPDGVLIGTVQQVDRYSSQVLLTTSLDSLVNGMIHNDSASLGLLHGSYNTALTMELIPQSDAVKVGQTVVTSGADQYIPRGLVIGSIESVTDVPSAVFRTATVTPLFSLDQLFIVSIIIP
jgi:rod shape-determining protein MreC